MPVVVNPSVELLKWLKDNDYDNDDNNDDKDNNNKNNENDIELQALLNANVPRDVLKTSTIQYRYRHSTDSKGVEIARQKMESKAYNAMMNRKDDEKNSKGHDGGNSTKQIKKDVDKLLTLLFQVLLSALGVFQFARQYFSVEKSLLVGVVVGTIFLVVEIFLIF